MAQRPVAALALPSGRRRPARGGNPPSIREPPATLRAGLARENGRRPNNPLFADSGDGWADSTTAWRRWSINDFFRRAAAPQRMNTTRSGLSLTTAMTRSVKVSHPLP